MTYVKNLPAEPFANNPKPFFGFSDNTHFMNFLWLNNIPSYYGGALFTQFAMQGKMSEYTVEYLKKALFEQGEVEIKPSDKFNDIDLDWSDPENLSKERTYEPNEGWFWDGNENTSGITWGGCLESIDEILRHGIDVPSLKDFENMILMAETSEEVPRHDYVFRVYRVLGEKGILKRVKAVLVGRPRAWNFDNQQSDIARWEYREKQRDTILEIVRKYNSSVPIIQNLDFGHTNPQIPMPYRMPVRLDGANKKIFVTF